MKKKAKKKGCVLGRGKENGETLFFFSSFPFSLSLSLCQPRAVFQSAGGAPFSCPFLGARDSPSLFTEAALVWPHARLRAQEKEKERDAMDRVHNTHSPLERSSVASLYDADVWPPSFRRRTVSGQRALFLSFSLFFSHFVSRFFKRTTSRTLEERRGREGGRPAGIETPVFSLGRALESRGRGQGPIKPLFFFGAKATTPPRVCTGAFSFCSLTIAASPFSFFKKKSLSPFFLFFSFFNMYVGYGKKGPRNVKCKWRKNKENKREKQPRGSTASSTILRAVFKSDNKKEGGPWQKVADGAPSQSCFSRRRLPSLSLSLSLSL